MKIVFFGSDEFAAVHMEHLLQSSHRVVGAVTQPDMRAGRGMNVVFSPIKIMAAEHEIKYLQPNTLKDPNVAEELKHFNADIFVVVAYGRLLTQEILDIPRVMCINVHGSLLPQYRGAAPVNWAILNGDSVTGVTVQKMALALDAGDVLAAEKIHIPADMTAVRLREQMAVVGARLLVKTLDAIEQGKHHLTPQDPKAVTYAPKLTKDMAQIHWNQSAAQIDRQIRGLKPWPGTSTVFGGKTLKVLSASVVKVAAPAVPGTIMAIDKKGITVACGQDALLLQDVQPEAGKAMSAASFIAGHDITINTKLS